MKDFSSDFSKFVKNVSKTELKSNFYVLFIQIQKTFCFPELKSLDKIVKLLYNLY